MYSDGYCVVRAGNIAAAYPLAFATSGVALRVASGALPPAPLAAA